ncbi:MULTISPECIES: aldehyde ferredoxin oxidoreductase family protein [Caldilinea]|jgi:aldehyde:ferredoxin oxidoreductase|uniref:Tungsten-containing aldehyde ferredoxin oxidoreductase n=2 Tax=Caldilinea aerophila TaxID=133453 RepID=I0I214_CALAS|nr:MULTISPECIES: aldehyde ferredoxin oxidoreductase family protein [Caldilinea]MBO9394578.1 aldehyde ferredoxin oxidoreductase family protein [Caldilinea sp.]BAL99301.1 tungsten-containing aldehyde ferredoxin oxidoreductase [Caldilinea aerophila DSM 14535 = NBRC 104270]GIV74105.1 MAG: aldehyde ferredoxin oxidoreductase [Caldilinea sp.]
MIGGFVNRVAWIDLTSGNIEYKGIDENDARKYIGARGLGVKYVFDNGPDVDPLSPDNILCVMNGPLTGTNVNMSGRLAVVTKSPLTGTVADSHMGGWTAAKLKWAGFDGLVFKGKAEKPVYAYVEDGKVTLHDASDVWGKGIHETLRILRERHGEDCDGMAIGQAGENLVRFACWVNVDDRAAGRNGTGCVAGSKHLKAIIIKGDKKNRPEPANRDADREARKKALAAIMAEENITSPRKGGLSVYGTNVLMNITDSIGALPAYNSQKTAFGKENAEKISGEYVNEHLLIDNPTCHACPVACKKEVEVKEGPFKVKMESVEYESAWALGSNCGNNNVESIAYMINMCNDYGMDPIELGNVLGMYMEASEKGYTNGAGKLAWGDAMGMVETIRKIAMREGVGDILANGTARAAAAFGHPEIAMTVKGQAIPAYDPRGLKGMGIAYATSNRGACHLRAYTPAAELGVMPFGSLKVDPLEWKGKGKLTKIFQDVHAVSDSLDLCKFSAFAEGMQEYTEQFNAVTGLNYTPDELLKCGERIYNLERYYNNLAGFGEGSDYLPKRFTTEPSTMPGSEGHVCELDLMLEEYYAERGWVNGVVPESKLRELEII